MICPECGGSTHVVETRDKSDGRVRRRRECLECGKLFSTTEAVNTRTYGKPKNPQRSSIERFLDVALKRY